MFGKYSHIYDAAKPYLQTRKNDVHVEICFRYARNLLDEEPGEPDIVLPAVICHDLGWIMLSEDLQQKAFGPTFDPELRRIHEVEGVKLARQVLMKVGYDPGMMIEVLEIIDGHDSRLLSLSDNDRIVKDADKLFRYDPIGMAIDMKRFKREASSYIQWLSGQIDQWFFTETAKNIARNEIRRLESN